MIYRLSKINEILGGILMSQELLIRFLISILLQEQEKEEK